MSDIRDIMTHDVIAFPESLPLEDALQSLIDNHISGAPVIDDQQRIVGVLSEADLLTLFWEKDAVSVGDIMTKQPRMFHVDAKVVEVLDCLMSNSFRRVLIHDDEQRCVGLVSRADLMPSVLSNLLERRARSG